MRPWGKLTLALWCKNFSPVFCSWMYSCSTFVQCLCAASDRRWSDASACSPTIESMFANSAFRSSHDAWNFAYSSASCILWSNIRSRYVQWSFRVTDLPSRSTLVSGSMYVSGGRLVEFTSAFMSIPRVWNHGRQEEGGLMNNNTSIEHDDV